MARLPDPQDPLFRALNSSVGFDFRLAPQDIRGSLAHARMLAREGIIGAEDLAAIEHGLAEVRKEVEQGRFEVHERDEDVHMAVERRLTELVGAPGARLHTARSRNDQVATDVALYVREGADRAHRLLGELMQTLIDQAEGHLDWAMPAYTHLQRAQPVYLSHHLLAHFWRLRRDRLRFAFAFESAGELPLGSGAVAGTNFDTDRDFLAEQLGFPRVSENSLDAVSNRDHVLDLLSAAATCATHLSQLGAELVLWSSEEFGFCAVADAFASGSSLMPQKKNPDAAELLRAKAPRVVGALSTLHGVLHALPLAYNKDLQEDKEQLFDALDTLELCLRVAAPMIAGTTFDRERMAAAAADELLAATDVADLLVRRGVPFREAHGIVGGLVREALASGRGLSALAAEELERLAPGLAPETVADLVRGHGVLESKVSAGGTSLARVREQLERARAALAEGAA
ncbi:MAG: argininosuccinate lyase [Actinomycetota bacterium]|nr:argininosuccinate lyase [Actinomycetota bacterium]